MSGNQGVFNLTHQSDDFHFGRKGPEPLILDSGSRHGHRFDPYGAPRKRVCLPGLKPVLQMPGREINLGLPQMWPSKR